MGIPIGSVSDLAPVPDRLTVEPLEYDFARIYVLPSGMAIVAPAKVTIRIDGILITDVAVTIPDIDYQLDLIDPTESHYYSELVDLLPYNQTEVINRWLTSQGPLRRRQVQGAIIAEGWRPVPATWHDGTLMAVELLLWDERRNELCFDFRARVDRSLMRKYERLQRERRERTPLTKPGLYEGGQLGDHKSVSREETIKPRHASREYDGEPLKPH